MPARYGLGTDTPKHGLRWLYLPFMLLLGVGSMVLATQRISAFFRTSPRAWRTTGHGLGNPLVRALVGDRLARAIRFQRPLWFY